LKSTWEELKKTYFIYDYKTSEILAENVLSKCTEATQIKSIYIDSLLHNSKPQQAIDFIKNKLTDQEKRKDEFEYFLCQAYYYDGK
jgi:hypothetical protein